MKTEHCTVLVKQKYKKTWHSTFIGYTDGENYAPLTCGHPESGTDIHVVFNCVTEAKNAALEFIQRMRKDGKKFVAKVVPFRYGEGILIDPKAEY